MIKINLGCEHVDAEANVRPLNGFGWLICDYCAPRFLDDSLKSCPAVFAGVFKCTREAGHQGPHAACGIRQSNHPVVMWDAWETPEAQRSACIDSLNR